MVKAGTKASLAMPPHCAQARTVGLSRPAAGRLKPRHRFVSRRRGGEPKCSGPPGSLRKDDRNERVAVGAVRAKGPAAVQRLRELVNALEIVDLGGEVRPVVDSARTLREERVSAERSAVARAVGRAYERVSKHLGLAAGVGDGCPLSRMGAVAEGDRLDLDRRGRGP